MRTQEKINFRQDRDFGETFGVSIRFLKQNFKPFMACLLAIAGPFLLISAMAGAYYQSSALTAYSFTNPRPFDIFNRLGWPYVIFILAAIVGNLSLVATVNGYLIEYQEKGPGNVTVAGVTQVVIRNIGGVLATFFVMFLLIILAIVVVGGIMIGIGSAVPFFAVLLAFALIIGMIILFPPFMWQLSAMYLIKMQEGRGVMESFGRTREVMRDNFWWTWVIVICSSLAIGIISFVFTIPQAAYQMVLMFSHLRGGDQETSIPFLVVSTVCTYCATQLYSGLYVINAFHYYSLAEKHDGTGLMERINEIGTTTTPDVDQHY